MILKFDEFVRLNESVDTDFTREIQKCTEEILKCVKDKKDTHELEKLTGKRRGLLITGNYKDNSNVIKKVIEKTKAEEDTDFVVIEESKDINGEKLEKILSENNDKVIFFKSMMFKDDKCFKILKEVTIIDEKEREFTYNNEKITFNGFIIFIVNETTGVLENAKYLKEHWEELRKRFYLIEDEDLNDDETDTGEEN